MSKNRYGDMDVFYRVHFIGSSLTFFILYLNGIWSPTLIGIAIMFGFGNAFDTVVSGLTYRYYLKRNKLTIFNPN